MATALDREEARDRRLVDVLAGVGMHDAAVLHDEDAVGDIEHEAQHLLADDDAEIAQVADVPQQPRDVLDDRRLNALGRLVEQQDLRIAGERARDRELLLLAAGQVAAAPAFEVLEDREQIVDFVRECRSCRSRPGRSRYSPCTVMVPKICRPCGT